MGAAFHRRAGVGGLALAVRIKPVMGLWEWLLLLVLGAVWGGSFLFNAIALAELRPLTTVLGRVALGAIALNLLVLASGNRMPRSLRLWGAFLVMGALNNLIPFSLILWGQTEITVGLAYILNAAMPLFTVVLAHLFLHDERLTANRIGGVLLGLAGVAVMIGLEALGGLGVHVLAQLAVVAATLSYGCASIFGRRFRALPPLVTAAGQVTGTALMAFPIAMLMDRPWMLAPPSLQTWGALAALALLSTALAYTIYFRILAVAGATNLVLVTFLIPVSGVLLGTLLLGERLDPRHFAGMALIGLGLAVMDGRILAALRTRFRPRPAVEPSAG